MQNFSAGTYTIAKTNLGMCEAAETSFGSTVACGVWFTLMSPGAGHVDNTGFAWRHEWYRIMRHIVSSD